MIDIHAHILPGFDDGAADLYDTLEMAAMAAKSGVTHIVATPHCNVPGMNPNYFGKEYLSVFQRASEAIKKEGIPVQLLPGTEAFATYDLPQLIIEKKVMPLNQSRYILMEFAFDENPDYANSVLKRVEEIGAKPVIAHAERYFFVQENPLIAMQWVKDGYAVQINKGSFLGGFGRHAYHTAHTLLEEGAVTVVASDAHGIEHRTTRLIDAYDFLRESYTKQELDLLFTENPKRICCNQKILALKERKKR